MKISKRILGVALALIMIFNVFAIGTFAAYPDDTLVSLGMTTDKTTYAPGDTIQITFNAECLEELGLLSVGGQYEIGYNSKVLEPSSTDTLDLEKHGFVGIQSGAALGSASIQMPAGSSGPSPLYDWDTTIAYCFGDDASSFDATTRVNLFTINMVVKADAPDGTYTIGFNPLGYEECNGYINDGMGFGGLYGTSASDYGFSVAKMYEYGTCTFTVSSAPAGPSVEVTHVGQQSKWNGGDDMNFAANYLFGFVGQFTGLEPETETKDVNGVTREEVTNIQSIIATATINGTEVRTANVTTIWEVEDGYQFRAQFAGWTPDSTDSVSVTFVITMSDGTTEYATADAATNTVKAIYEASVSKGLPEVVEA